MKKTFISSLRRRRGFTLIEIVLVLAIIMVLMGVAIKGISGFRDNARRTRAKADIDAVTSALTLYESNNLRLPTQEQGLQAMVVKPTTAPIPRNWSKLMKAVPLDPWGSEYQYRIPATRSQDNDYDLFSMGKDGKADTEDDVGNWELQ